MWGSCLFIFEALASLVRWPPNHFFVKKLKSELMFFEDYGVHLGAVLEAPGCPGAVFLRSGVPLGASGAQGFPKIASPSVRRSILSVFRIKMGTKTAPKWSQNPYKIDPNIH